MKNEVNKLWKSLIKVEHKANKINPFLIGLYY